MSTAPIDLAYSALADRIRDALHACGFLADPAKLAIDPEDAPELDGEATDLVSVAMLQHLNTAPSRAILGGGAPGAPRARYAVDRQARLELAIAGQDAPRRDGLLAAAAIVLADLCEADPTLGGAAERAGGLSLEPDDLPPNGRVLRFSFYVRVRSGDPFGLTP